MNVTDEIIEYQEHEIWTVNALFDYEFNYGRKLNFKFSMTDQLILGMYKRVEAS